MAQGSIGGAGSVITFGSPVSINCQLGANEYPSGTLTFDNISDGNAYWKNNGGYARSIDLYLCDSAGNNRVFLFTVSLNPNGSNTTIRQANVSGATGLMGKALYLVSTGDTEVVQLRRYTTITINTAVGTHDIAGVGATGGGFSRDWSTIFALPVRMDAHTRISRSMATFTVLLMLVVAGFLGRSGSLRQANAPPRSTR